MARPDARMLDRVVARLVEAVHPLRVVLFGSAARGTMRENSDLDLLVVVPDGTHCRRTAQQLYRDLAGLGVAKDIVVTTPEILARNSDNRWLVYYHALREGRELYRAVA